MHSMTEDITEIEHGILHFGEIKIVLSFLVAWRKFDTGKDHGVALYVGTKDVFNLHMTMDNSKILDAMLSKYFLEKEM